MTLQIRIFPARSKWPPAVEDLNSVPRDARRLRLVQKTLALERLREFKDLEALWCFSVDQNKLNYIAECTSLSELFIEYNFRATNLTVLKNLPHLRILRLDSNSKLTTLEQLADFGDLEGLSLENLKNVHSIKPIEGLTSLKQFAVEGSIWTRMKIDSLAPLAKLMNLEFLGLTNLKVLDESLKPLQGLTHLKQILIANFYPVAEFAKLSAWLPNTECHWFFPYMATTLTCEKCKSDKRVLLTGKGKSMLCLTCDAGRIARHAEKFRCIKNDEARGISKLAKD